MALTATLAIDIRQFEAGLKSAQVELQTFERATKNVNRDLKRLMEDFSGQRVVVEASRMSEAVERIGGASRLTATEQARVNAVVSEAIAKYRALGEQAPAHLVALQRATAGAVQQTSLLTRGTQLLVGLFSARAILGAANQVLDFTGKLSDLEGKTGVTAEALQRLNFVTSQSGVGLEQIANAAVQLGRRLVNGDASAVQAVQRLGLSLSDLIAQGPEQAFYAIGQAVASVPNPMERAALATDLFGRTGADLLPAFTANMRSVADEAQRSGAILSNDLVRSGEAAGDALTRLKTIGLSLVGQLLIPMLPAVEAVANWLGTALPAALGAARSGFDSLIRAGLQFRAWIYDVSASVAQTVRDVPIMGRVFGQSAADVAGLKVEAQLARDALAAFNVQGVQPATQGVQQAAPLTRNYAEALEHTERAAGRAARALPEVARPLQQQTTLVSRAISETANLTRQLEAWARTNAAVLAPSIQQVNAALDDQVPLINQAELIWSEFPGTVQQSTTQSGNGISGFFQRIFGDSQTLGQNISSIFQAAFTGGGGALGAVQAFATQALSSLFAMIPGVGQWISAFAGPIVAMLTRVGGRIADFFRTLFGGPSRDELNGRNLVNEFENNVIGLLNAQQQAEAGGERWRQVVIGIRDAYLANGLSAEQAEADVARLWASSREGAEASRRVIDEINARLHRVGDTATDVTDDTGDTASSVSDAVQETADEATRAIEKIARALDRLPDVIDIEIRPRYGEPGGEPVPGATTPLSALLPGSPALTTSIRTRDAVRSAGVTLAGGPSVTVPVYLDGRKVAEAMAPHLPSALNFLGVRSSTWP